MDVRKQLSEAGRRLEQADDERATAMADLAAAVRAAHAELPIAEIARLGGISRPTVYKMLEEQP